MSITFAWKQRVLSMLAVVLCVVLHPGSSAWGQSDPPHPGVIDLDREREPVTRVSTLWKFHPGHDPRWAEPDIDDSTWKTLNPQKNWDTQGYTTTDDQAWFRFKLHVAPGSPDLLLQIPRMMKNYQLFANGKQIGQVGSVPPMRGGLATGAARVFTLPATNPSLPEITIALRVWRPRELAFISSDVLAAPVVVGTSAALLPQFTRAKASTLLQRSGMEYTATLIQVPIMAAAMLLFWLTRERFYLWFGFNMLLGAVTLATRLLASHFAWDFRASLTIYILWDFLGGATLALFVGGYLALRERRLVWVAILLWALGETGPILVPFHLPAVWADVIYFVCITTSNLLLVWLVVRAWKSGVLEAGLFLIPFALGAGVSCLTNLGYIFVEMHVPGIEAWLPSEITLVKAPFLISLMDVSAVMALFGFLAVLVVRFWRTIRDQQRLSSALQAAHEIQGRLVPESTLLYRNLKSEVVYLAAEEVGGDFCQVLPRKDGSLLAVIGDVSGKGLQAAMIGALAVGALRSLVHEICDPAEVLDRMNEVMLRSDLHGFVTCLCLVIGSDGMMMMASAGHPPPYVNGIEAACEPGLPLGLIADASYAQSVQVLPPEARLTLLSDGVLEARSPTGELFGFTRMQQISKRPAGEIAAAAQRFGQQDDITVMTLDWTANLVLA